MADYDADEIEAERSDEVFIAGLTSGIWLGVFIGVVLTLLVIFVGFSVVALLLEIIWRFFL